MPPSSDSKLVPLKAAPLISVCIPAYNEQENIGRTIDVVAARLERDHIPYEFVIANDNSKDGTEAVVRERMAKGIPIRLVNRVPPGGFGRALRSCFEHFRGDIVAVVMADLSDDPDDIVKCYRKINEGYDAVFGSRFIKGAVVKDYPFVKLLANRFGNKLIQLMFRTRHNDLTNAFKVYRAEALRSIMPLYSSHFNLTIEISLGMLIRGFNIAAVPVNWYGRTWGVANFKIKTLGRRYFATMFKLYAERIFIHDDVMAEHEVKLRALGSTAVVHETLATNISDEENSSNRRSWVRGI
ncbi:MAG: glycosyltransferase family 2 protein [Oligoflexia bacterium]|nr:glycosyltransferase family 2 protein [Oligoflexia bacterium]